MHLEKMAFDHDDGVAYPNEITVTMSLREALWIAKVAGQQRGASPHNGIYSCLTGDVFNRYWDGGVDDAIKGQNVVTPPVRYDD